MILLEQSASVNIHSFVGLNSYLSKKLQRDKSFVSNVKILKSLPSAIAGSKIETNKMIILNLK